ncbi:hypothetical protein IWX63_001042 [Arthrobacter sp. CAN_A2]|uniref:DUF4244 domain-containing protein n=1 Tax=Arthrobacter sp. CAN_A2 TaxID=2787718 RepID=UPI001A1FD31F
MSPRSVLRERDLLPPLPERQRLGRAEGCAVTAPSFLRPARSVDAGSEAGAEAEPGTDRYGGGGPAPLADRAARRAAARRRRADDRVIRRVPGRVMDQEAGMATAEYAIATLAAVGFAALLVAVLSSGEIKGLLMSLITSALNFG